MILEYDLKWEILDIIILPLKPNDIIVQSDKGLLYVFLLLQGVPETSGHFCFLNFSAS